MPGRRVKTVLVNVWRSNLVRSKPSLPERYGSWKVLNRSARRRSSANPTLFQPMRQNAPLGSTERIFSANSFSRSPVLCASEGEIPAAAAQTGSGRTSGGSAMRNLPLLPSSSLRSSSAVRYENSAIGPDLFLENVSIE